MQIFCLWHRNIRIHLVHSFREPPLRKFGSSQPAYSKFQQSLFIHNAYSTKIMNYPRRRTIILDKNDLYYLRATREDASLVDLVQESEAIELQRQFEYPLDSWQLEAGIHIKRGKSVVVCAPTGAGKTVVGEMALRHAFEQGLNAIYTTPLKALSNQKFVELRQLFGTANVGLSTGDMSINRNAPIMVMTTEVYRNMAWRETTPNPSNLLLDAKTESYLSKNAVVVLDEFHYMGQRGRGGVWEECVITCPRHTQLVALSATLPNASQLTRWIQGVTGRPTQLVDCSSDSRPVPLRYLFANRDGLSPLFRDADAGPGAPNGLLGLRGDGITQTKKGSIIGSKKKGFVGRVAEKEEQNVFPRGLQLNSELLKSKDRIMTKVDRNLKRQELRAQEEEGGRGRGRGRDRNSESTYAMSPREQQRQRDRLLRQEMRRSVPSLPFLIRRLDRQSLLPAIVFIFSRAGCDDAARSVAESMLSDEAISVNSNPAKQKRTERQSQRSEKRRIKDDEFEFYNEVTGVLTDLDGRQFRDGSNTLSEDAWTAILDQQPSSNRINKNDLQTERGETELRFYAQQGLLPYEAVKEVAQRIESFNEQNPEISLNDSTVQQLLLGVGSHHAGQLAAHKTFVETLFRMQLLKVIFATETLAAGINVPARTTVITSLAKRGDGGTTNLLETSNLLQMAGRAGRRGMDTDGTCVILQTPFEGADEAAFILCSEIKPISSQFSPSYTLAVNLIGRGGGTLDVARDLIQKSFAMWEKQQQNQAPTKLANSKDQLSDSIVMAVAQERFLMVLKDVALDAIEMYRNGDPIGSVSTNIEECLATLSNARSLKKASKSYSGIHQLAELEKNTLAYLQYEADEYKGIASALNDALGEVSKDDVDNVQIQIETQLKRIQQCESDIVVHPLTSVACLANTAIELNWEKGPLLKSLLNVCRSRVSSDEEANIDEDESDEAESSAESSEVTAFELAKFVKSFKVLERKRDKLKLNGSSEATKSLDFLDASQDEEKFDVFDEMKSLVRVLESFGCIVADTRGKERYSITTAGSHVAMMNFDNTLWALVAMGGAHDVQYNSKRIDEISRSLDFIYKDDSDDSDEIQQSQASQADPSLPAKEAQELVSAIRDLIPSELAGYVSCLVAEGSRDGNYMYSMLEGLSLPQQRVIQSALLSGERLLEVQRVCEVDEDVATSVCPLDLTTCHVVTQWAAGCSWNEALEMSGLQPGDLARVLHRVLDALRQFGALPYRPARSSDSNVSAGLHPDIRRLCRDAATAMDRYPLKDPLPLSDDEDIEEEEFFDEDQDQVMDTSPVKNV